MDNVNLAVSENPQGISIYPAITEIKIGSGEEIPLTYTVKNEGDDSFFMANIHLFIPLGSEGRIMIQKNLTQYDPGDYLSWFKYINPKIRIGGSFFLEAGSQKDITLLMTVPDSAIQQDYYFTVTFETIPDQKAVNNVSYLSVKSGSNILLSVSNDINYVPDGEIRQFSFPKLIDSFMPLNYRIVFANNGLHFIKPSGIIEIDSLSGRKEKLTLTPLNVLSGSERQLFCRDRNQFGACRSNSSFLFGLYKSTVKINLPESDKSFESGGYTFAFPFTLIFIMVIILFALLKLKKKLIK